MKTIIAGSRNITSYHMVRHAIYKSGFGITEVVSGGARGVERLGETYAREHNIPVRRFIPDWNRHGKAAGIIRNKQMGDYADALIAVWDGYSRGTNQMIEYAEKKGLSVYVYRLDEKFGYTEEY